MAKGREVISTFHGGMVTNKASRDLDSNESVELIGLSTMQVGSLISANIPVKVDADSWDEDASRNMVTGYGFFTFETDWDLNSDGVAPNEAATTIICWHTEDSANTYVQFVDQEDHSGGGTSTITWTDHDGYPAFYTVNGAVRVSDANLANTANTPKWFGICPQKFQDGEYFGDKLSDLLVDNQKTFFDDLLDDNDNVFDFGGNNADGATTLIDTGDTPDHGFAATTATFIHSSGVGLLTNTASATGRVYLILTTIIGKQYDVKFDVTAINNSNISVSLSTNNDHNGSNYVTSSGSSSTNNSLGTTYTAAGTTTYLVLKLSSSGSGHWVKIDNLSVFETNTIKWRQMDNNLLPPGACISNTSGTVLPSANATIQNGKGFGLQLTKTSGQTEGKWATGVYTFAGSNVYLDNQESKLTSFNNTLTIADADRNEFIEPVLWTTVPSSSGLSNAARQTGGRIYYRRNNRSWKLFLDFSYEFGTRTTLDDDYVGWTENGGGYESGSAVNLQVKEPYPITYESLNGHRSGDLTALSFGASATYGYKTSVIAQSRAWVANVKYPDENGTLKTMGDRILYSPPNKYDTFPNTYWLDIGASDGENFTALIEHSGFLFAFKENTLYIVNIQSPVESGWRVQNKLPHYGIKAPYAVCKTKDGIYWVNGEGVYLWQAGQIKEVSLKVSPGISSDLGDNSIIGYDVVNREVYIRADGSGTNAVVWIFHTPTQSWYKDTLHADFARLQSNFDHNARNIRWMLEDGSSDQFLIGRNTKTSGHTDNNSTTFSLKTKDITFGNVGIKKKVYGFTMTYKAGAVTAIQYRYALDQGTAISAVNFPTQSADPSPQRIEFTTPLICQSFQLYILTSSTNSVSIRDISIEYRLLSTSKVD